MTARKAFDGAPPRTAMRSRAVILIFFAFVAMNLAVIFVLPADSAMRHGGESTTWTRPAEAMLKYGAYVKPDDPSKPDTHRGPGYPTFLAGTMVLAGDGFPRLAVGFQLALLFATGLVAMRFTDRVLPGYGVAALALVVFNPNALGTVHLIQAETLYALLITLLVWTTLSYAAAPSPRLAAAAGAFLGAASLVRPEGQFLVVLLPIALIILPSIKGPPLAWRRRFLAAGLCLALSAVFVVPWMARNQAIGQGFGLSSLKTAGQYLWGSAAQVEIVQYRINEREAERRMAARRQALIAGYGERWQSFNETEKLRLLARGAVTTILAAEPAALAELIVEATVQFFTGGGAGNILNQLGMGEVNAYEVFSSEGYTDYFAAWLSAIDRAGWGAILVWIVALGFVAVLRLLGLVGLVTMMRRGHWRTLFIAFAAVAYFALVIPFYGISRFRLPVEPLLILMALYGWDGLRFRARARARPD